MLKNTLLIVLAVFLIAIGPFITIWALNTLFPTLAISYTLNTWLASAIFTGIFATKYR